METKFKYALLTACRNEEDYIEATINSVVSQTIMPQKWIIINDGSTDNTEEILLSYSKKYTFIQVINKLSKEEGSFGSKADAINLGYSYLKHLDFGFIGNLDADITFDSTYYEVVLNKLKFNDKLGLAGGVRVDNINGKFIPVRSAANSVPGAFQLFRKKCWEEIGGYMPLEYGGIDAVAEITARMKGWQVKSYPDLILRHHRVTGNAQRNVLVNSFRSGIKDYMIGYHPLFQILKSIERMRRRPFLVGGALQLFGYFSTAIIRPHRPVRNELVKYLRSEQLQRIKNVLLMKSQHATI
jgi:glycosyltransferase involved in cell wall biosynthesis